ncbi:hypothetical protein A5724_04990 [Mycobacterium sp. ACS1612]|uniref:hypothetical protein n=1 Tax=Mycobacterium sp. ACS1612 TaxID=1834117 RepID=UPI0007FFF68A|nr:hypothetical protein [Mycobacterium sp. ACS1612]OBF40942.1 hypothetical protein A5724_04990 [Mycobacterium sp. ACS1612]
MLYQQPHRSFPSRHPLLTGAGLLVALWWLNNGWYEALAAVAIVGLLVAVTRRRRALEIRRAGLRARADFEHRLTLAGDPRGVFGRYPPVQPVLFPEPPTVRRQTFGQ